MSPIVYLDTETTSLGPKREPWEIAMIRRDGEERKEISFFVEDVNLSKADPMSLKFSRFYERHPSFGGSKATWITKALRFDDEPPYYTDRYAAAQIVHEWTRDALIVGNVVNFDTEMLERVLRDEHLVPAWRYHLRDIEGIAAGWLTAKTGNPHWLDNDWDSDELSRMCGVEPPSDEDRHTALGDALWAERWYNAIMRGGVE